MSTMKKPSEYPKANHSSYSEGETLWHRAFFAAMIGLLASTADPNSEGIGPRKLAAASSDYADLAMEEIERREKGEQ